MSGSDDSSESESGSDRKTKRAGAKLAKAAANALNKPKLKSGRKNLTGCMEDYKKNHRCFSTRIRIYKNVLVLSSAFFLLFSAFMGLVNLQTSIHHDATPIAVVPQKPLPQELLTTNISINDITHDGDKDLTEFVPDLNSPGADSIDKNEVSGSSGLGAYSMSVVYAGLIVSSLFFTQMFINRFTMKWTIVLSISVYCGYILANLSPSWLTLIPTSLLMGIAAAPLWTAQSAYITEMGRLLAQVIGLNKSLAGQKMALTNTGIEVPESNNIDSKPSPNQARDGVDIPDAHWIDETDTCDEDLQDEVGQIMYKEMSMEEHSDTGPESPPIKKPNSTLDSRRSTSLQKVRGGRGKKYRGKDLTDKSIPHLMGIFFCFFQGGQIFGNLISSVTLQSDLTKIFDFPTTTPLDQNAVSYDHTSYALDHARCGGQYCPHYKLLKPPLNFTSHNVNVFNQSIHRSEAKDSTEQLKSKINMLCYVYAMMCMLAAVLVALFLDPISLPDPSTTTKKHSTPLTNPDQATISSNPYESTLTHNNKIASTSGAGLASTASPLLPQNERPSTTNKTKGSGGFLPYTRHFSYPIMSMSSLFSRKSNLNPSIGLPIIDHRSAAQRRQAYFHELGSTFRHIKNRNQLLLIPLTIYVGLEQGFIAADFTRAFVTCYFGMHFVGIVMAMFGVVDAFHSIVGGSFNNIMPRYVIFGIAAVAHLTCIPLLQHYPHFGSRFTMVLAAVSLWGAGDGIFQPQLNGFYGAVFSKRQETSAFANYRLWEAVGFIISFSIHEKFCIQTKLYLLMVTLVIGMSGYGMVEYRLHKRRPKNTTFRSIPAHP